MKPNFDRPEIKEDVKIVAKKLLDLANSGKEPDIEDFMKIIAEAYSVGYARAVVDMTDFSSRL